MDQIPVYAEDVDQGKNNAIELALAVVVVVSILLLSVLIFVLL